MKKVEAVMKRLTGLLKSPGLLLPCLFALGLLAYAAPAASEVPVKFTYQGNLRQGGFLITGQRSMNFGIYDSSTSGTLLWQTASAMSVAVSTGVFRVALEPSLADWQAGSLWLELEVEGNRMSPREEITSVPFSINTLMLSGKRYTTAASAPAALAAGDLWMDSATGSLKYWNGSSWVPTAGSGLPGAHAATHEPGGSDTITALGTHSVTGYMTVSSSVTAGWFSGDGAGIYSLDASRITLGQLSGDRVGNVIVSTHIVDGAIQGQDLADGAVTNTKLNQSGCTNGQVLKWDGALGSWECSADSIGGGGETDPLSIHNQETLQSGATFYVSSGTVNYLTVNNDLRVNGTAQLKGSAGEAGLTVSDAGNVGVGAAAPAAVRLQVRGEDSQTYSLAIGTGTANQVVVSTSGAVGVGTDSPRARMEVTGAPGPGEYIMIFNSGDKLAAWLRNK